MADPSDQVHQREYGKAVGRGDVDQVIAMLDAGVDMYSEWWHRRIGALCPALIAASAYGHEKIVSVLLDRGFDININFTAGGSIGSALIGAAAFGHVGLVRLLLDRGAVIDAIAGPTTKRGTGGDAGIMTALIAAAKNGKKDVVSLLLDRGADVNMSTTDGAYGTALIAAAAQGRTDVAELLLDRGAEIEVSMPGTLSTALIGAAGEGRKDVVSLLLRRGANVHKMVPGSWYGTALAAAATGGHLEVLSLLLNPDANTGNDAWAASSATALIAATERGHKEVVSLLLDRRCDINATAPSGHYGTPLIAAAAVAMHGHIAQRGLLPLLLEKGADVNMIATTGDYGYATALIAAAAGGDISAVSLLLNAGADVNLIATCANAKDLVTPLITAILRNRPGVVQLLLDRGADPNLIVIGANPGAKMGTALIAAASCSFSGKELLVSMLLNQGADVNLISTVGDYGTALIAATARNGKDMVSLLLNRGAHINTITSSHYGTALIAAVSRVPVNSELITVVLDRGADINAVVNESGHDKGYGTTALNTATALLTARMHAQQPNELLIQETKKILTLLISGGADVNVVTDDFGTALGRAVYEGDEDAFSFLWERGADVFHVGGNYHTACGEYPNALDAARAGKAGLSLRARISRAMGFQDTIGPSEEQLVDRWPPFPMPYTCSRSCATSTSTDAPIAIIERILTQGPGYNLAIKEADFACKALGMDVMVKLLVSLVGINKEAAERHKAWIENDTRYFMSHGYDLGLAYAACRVAWKDFNSTEMLATFNIAVQRGRWLRKAAEIDAERNTAIGVTSESKEFIKSPYQVMPRRMWDVKSNRVVEFRMLHSDVSARKIQVAHQLQRVPNSSFSSSECPIFWAITHSWTSIMNPVQTSINQNQWPVPLPENLNFERDLREELLTFGAEYVWLDVLCLRQFWATSLSMESIRMNEWKLDVPTIGNVYRAAAALVRYFNGLGIPFSNQGWDGPRHWLQRAWTLQEIKSENMTLNGGLSDESDGESVRVLMDAQGVVINLAGKPEVTTLRRAIRSVVKLAMEVDSANGCSIYELVREMAKRHCTQATDRVAGLLYLLRITQLPTYDGGITDEEAWDRSFDLLPFERKIELLFDFPSRGAEDQWFPKWTQLLEWPQRDPEYDHVRSLWLQPENYEHLDLHTCQQLATPTDKLPFLLVPDIWALPDVPLKLIKRNDSYNQFQIKIGNRAFGFYSPYRDQTVPIGSGLPPRLTLATVSVGNSNNWVLCEELATQKASTGGKDLVDIMVLRKVGVLATDSCSELFVQVAMGKSDSRLKKIHARFV